MVYSQAQLEEKVIHTTEVLSESYQTCLEIYQTPKVELKINLEDFKKQLPAADLNDVEEEFEKSLSLLNKMQKMISQERKRRRYIQQLKNKRRLADVKTNVKSTRKQKRLESAGSVVITNGITESKDQQGNEQKTELLNVIVTISITGYIS